MNKWDFKAADFAVLRTPLLPENSTAKLCSNTDSQDTRTQLTQSLLELKKMAETPEISQSIRLASASLYEQLGQLDTSLTTKNLKLASSIYKYIVRMSTRSTPFGAFSSVMSLPVTDKTAINIPSRMKLFARLDNSCVKRVAELFKKWCADSEHLDLLIRVNSSLYELGGEYRFVSQTFKESYSTYQMDAVQINQAIQSTIEFSKNWVTVRQVVEHLKQNFKQADEYSLIQFVYDLMDNQIIESNLSFVVGTHNSFNSLISRAKQSRVKPELIQHGQEIGDLLESVNVLGDSELTDKLTQAKASLEQLLPGEEPKKWIHVDAFRDQGKQSISHQDVSGVVKTMEKLAGLFWNPGTQLKEFTQQFISHYEDAEVPLLEALDVDSGISFGPQRNGRSPLLKGIGRSGQNSDQQIRWRFLDTLILNRVVEAIKNNQSQLTIKAEDLEVLKPHMVEPNRSFFDTASIMGSFLEPQDEEEPLFMLNSISGPSALSLLGRFCCGDQYLAQSCQDLAEVEQQLNPNTIKAEIIHAQQANTANISGRPQIRPKEIIYSPGDSDIDEAHQIKCEDLYLKVKRGQLILFSKQLNCEIEPRMASAHNTTGLNLPVYQFLHAMQFQKGYFSSLGKSRPLGMLPYIPEIRFENIVLSPQRWLINVHEINSMIDAKDINEKLEQLQQIKTKRNLSECVAISEGDNILEFDLSSSFSSLMFINEISKKKRTVILIDSMAQKTTQEISAGGNKFRHEVVLPILTSFGEKPLEKETTTHPTISISEAKQQASLPNENWKYLKVYAGEASADRLLADHLSVIANRLVAEGKITHWHFIRYQDPEFHIRLRLKLKKQFQTDEIDALLYPRIKSLYQQGLVTRVLESSHMPEFERYGGPDVLPLCEQLFYHNSVIVTDFIKNTASFTNRDELRWQLCLNLAWQLALGVCESLDDLEQYFKNSAAGYDWEFGNNEFTKKKLSENYRMNMKQVAAAVSPQFLESFQSPTVARMHANYSKTVQLLKAACVANHVDVMEILPSLIHMDCNRTFVLHGRANEWISYHYLARYTRTVIARKFKPGKQVLSGLGQSKNRTNQKQRIG